MVETGPVVLDLRADETQRVGRETEDTPAHKRVPFDDDDPADDWHKRVGAALRDLAALRDSHAREDGELIFISIWAISMLTSCFV